MPVESWSEETFGLELRGSRRNLAVSQQVETEAVAAAADPLRFRLDPEPEATVGVAVDLVPAASPDPH